MKSNKTGKQIIIVGAGMSGLTSAIYLSKFGYKVKVLEKSNLIGGLVQSFEKDGFVFDTGPRAIGNAGITKPLLEDLGIDLPLVKSFVTIGIEDQLINFNSYKDIDKFIASLDYLFPSSSKDINKIYKKIKSYTKMMIRLNHVSNPYFKHIPSDFKYLFLRLIPWLPSFFMIILRTLINKSSIENDLCKISKDSSLIDMISQHFFNGTPKEFVYGYFQNFQDYLYPLGGTGNLPLVLYEKAKEYGVEFILNSEVTGVELFKKEVISNGNIEKYDALLWAGDINKLYKICNTDYLSKTAISKIRNKQLIYSKTGTAESVYSIFIAVNLQPEYFSNISHGHFIYTPNSKGLGSLKRESIKDLKADFHNIGQDKLFSWIKDFCKYNTYEISIPVLKDPKMAPDGKTALIISLLFDGELSNMIKEGGWYKEFKDIMYENIINNIDNSIYPNFKDKILYHTEATPSTLENLFGNSNGAIVGWSMENKVPVADNIIKVASSVNTVLPRVYKAGQWTYSPSGVPIAILTGRIAAQKISSKV